MRFGASFEEAHSIRGRKMKSDVNYAFEVFNRENVLMKGGKVLFG